MHVAIAGVHVQRDKQSSAQHPRVRFIAGGKDRREHVTAEYLLQRRSQLTLPRHTQAAILQQIAQPQLGAAPEPSAHLG